MAAKRISAEFSGDNAIKAEIIYVSTGLAEETKKDADAIFCGLSLLCIESALNDCRIATGVQYPSHLQLSEFLSQKLQRHQ